MAALYDWMRTLILVVLLASLLEMALPAGEVRKFVRLVLGLLVVLAVVEPLARLLPQGTWLLGPTAQRTPEAELDVERWLAAGAEVARRGREAVAERYAGAVARQAADLAALAAGTPARAEPRFSPEGRLVGLRVLLEAAEPAAGGPQALPERVRGLLAALYGVAPEQIEVIWRQRPGGRRAE